MRLWSIPQVWCEQTANDLTDLKKKKKRIHPSKMEKLSFGNVNCDKNQTRGIHILLFSNVP